MALLCDYSVYMMTADDELWPLDVGVGLADFSEVDDEVGDLA